MESNNIFDNKERTDPNFANHLDDVFDFYDRSAKPEFAKVRDVINQWFTGYPQSEKSELKSRFKKAFSPAFFELFIYQLFTRQGFTLTPHPPINGTRKAPDFLAEKGDLSFYIEAKEATDTSDNEAASKKKIDVIYDAISKLKIPNYWLTIEELKIKTTAQPSGRKIVETLERQLPGYISNIAAANLEISQWGYIKPLTINRDDVKLVVSVFPKSLPENKQESSPTIGVYPGHSSWGYGEEEIIKDAVHRKASRYGELDRPYLICINAFTRLGITANGVENALLGTEVGRDSSSIDNTELRGKRAKNGVFYSDSGPTKTRVSGIFVTSVFPSNVNVAPHWLVKHPCGKLNFDFAQLQLNRLEFNGEYWQSIEGQSIGEILKD